LAKMLLLQMVQHQRDLESQTLDERH
jgi:hypothetical protein